MTIEGQLGTIAQGNVREVIAQASEAFQACYTRRLEVIPVLSGAIELRLRVGVDGRVRYALPVQSGLGDGETEACMLGVARALVFEAPCGGEAEVTHRAEYDPGPDVRAATPLAATRFDAALRTHRRALAACAGASGLDVQAYIAPDGRVMAGAGASSEAQLTARSCALGVVTGWRMPPPGSWWARSRLTLP